MSSVAREHFFPPRSRVVRYGDDKIAAVITSTRAHRFQIMVDTGYVYGGENLRGLIEAARTAKKPFTLRQWAALLEQDE